ncbi:hypothetical protein amrb99_76960 [Actinomadura sp. RB99]|uniref:hypothetical protein n=1 Tax=Actinomadura sp. RB99 TaxID=2691577 RepID=UPI001687A839|nr:hypothetical protein [Actinomadura sp. RB99]MBD2898723.1 hypothetical protein [Actinomadura sp. RB99]
MGEALWSLRGSRSSSGPWRPSLRPGRGRGVKKALVTGATAFGMSLCLTACSPTAAPASPVRATATAPDHAPVLTAAAFQHPPASVRPKYRWWVPLADTEDGELRTEVGQIAASGAGAWRWPRSAFPEPG